MAIFNGTIYSKTLNMDTCLTVVLPQDSRKYRGVEPYRDGVVASEKPKTLILLHGLSDNHNAWAQRTSILRYAEDYGIAVVIPEVQRSFYQNMKNGPNYFDYINDELPELVSDMFHLSIAPEDLFLAGLSMGGYGVLACGLTYPERYQGIGVFSAVCDLRSVVLDETFAGRKELQGWLKDRPAIFGEDIEYPESMDVYTLIDNLDLSRPVPRIYMACGTEDFLYEQNVELKNYISNYDLDFAYEEWPGIHEWAFWDVAIQKVMQRFLLDQQ